MRAWGILALLADAVFAAVFAVGSGDIAAYARGLALRIGTARLADDDDFGHAGHKELFLVSCQNGCVLFCVDFGVEALEAGLVREGELRDAVAVHFEHFAPQC